MDVGWLGLVLQCRPLVTDALGQLLIEYAKQVYNSQLQHLKDNEEDCKAGVKQFYLNQVGEVELLYS
ncbi:hypothetical protein M8C21_021138 [Ambrosia artemisiifolia]|uniref:Uncharacterized protein n=1 Tax=Ambrosia artemisiifolia TaxID=4212 RepID=A0AAD5GHF5_AMBAR|nr:hypothetical protein M8C21_021138 [Ambrosia artemisiifolia]